MNLFKKETIQVISSYLIICILAIALLYFVPKYIAWNKVYFARINKVIEKIKTPQLIITQGE